MTFRAAEAGEAAQADFAVCLRVADLPPISSYPPSVQADAREQRQQSSRQPCQKCGMPILVSNATPASVPAVCTHCHQEIQAIAARASRRGQ